METMVAIIISRGNITEEQGKDMLVNTAVDALWDDVGPILDRLEEGEYMYTDD